MRELHEFGGGSRGAVECTRLNSGLSFGGAGVGLQMVETLETRNHS